MSRRWYRAHAEATTFSPDRLAARLIDEPAHADERYFCDDIPDLDDESLVAERIRLRVALALSPPRPWAVERLRLIEAELKSRSLASRAAESRNGR